MASQASIGRRAAILVRVMEIVLALLAVEIVLRTLGVASWRPFRIRLDIPDNFNNLGACLFRET